MMRWRILALLFFARIGLGFQFQTLTSVGDDLASVFGLDYGQIGTLIGLFMIPGLFLAMPAGLAGGKFQDRTLAVFGLMCLAAGGAISGQADDTWTIGIGRVVAGAGFLVSTLYFTKMIADWFVGREIATAMSILVMSWPMGIALGQIGHEWLATQLDWRAPFLAASIYCTVAALAVLLFYRPPQTATSTGDAVRMRPTRSEWTLVLLAGSAWGVFNAGYVGYLTYGPLMLEAHGASALTAAAVISIGSWVMIFSGAVCGQIVDRTGWALQAVVFCMLVATGSLMLLAINGAGAIASALFGLVGMAPAGVIMAMAGQAMKPEQRAIGMGVFFTVYYAIMTVGPPVSGALFDATGSAFTGIMLAAAMFLSVIPLYAGFRLAKRLEGERHSATPPELPGTDHTVKGA